MSAEARGLRGSRDDATGLTYEFLERGSLPPLRSQARIDARAFPGGSIFCYSCQLRARALPRGGRPFRRDEWPRAIAIATLARFADRKNHIGGPVNILGINSVYHESAAALLVDGKLAAAAEEERFNRIKHGKPSDFDNPHQLPEKSIRFCLKHAGLAAREIDHVAYSFDPK